MNETKKVSVPSKLSDHYSNILLIAPDSQPLATIPAKRARWYKERNLVETLENREGFTEVLRLKNEPKGRSSKNVCPLENRCVVCGQALELSVHHVVPIAIRKYFPDALKTHAHGWCVLLCEKHHLAAEKLARALYEKPLQIAVGQAHQEHTKICYNLIKIKIAQGQSHEDLDLKELKKFRSTAISEAHQQCVEEIIKKFGGYSQTKEKFKSEFMKLNPQFLPAGFLSDVNN